MNDLTNDFNGLFGDKLRLPASIEHLRLSYQAARPFRHLIIDDLFSDQLLDTLVLEMGKMAAHQWIKNNIDPRESTARMRSGADLGPAGIQLTSIVHSAAFLYLLSEISGVWQLLPDPYLQGAGYAQMRRGDHFQIHSDRSVAYNTGLTRRLAMIIFLNKSWPPEFAGQLELWNDDSSRCEVSIEPKFNRTVLFEVASPNFHGVPAPLTCPSDRLRQSFILYYHTADLHSHSNVRPHSSIFAPQFSTKVSSSLRAIVRDITPPFIRRGIMKLLNRI